MSGFKNPFSLTHKLVVLVGATGGLGHAVSRAVVQAGAARVALVDSGPGSDARLRALEQELAQVAATQTQTLDVASWKCDITQGASVDATMAEIFARDAEKSAESNKSYALVNMAGVCENVGALEYPQERIARVLDINLLGSMLVAREFARQALRHAPKPAPAPATPAASLASIVLVASMSGTIVNHPQPQAPYNMSKAGVIHLAKSLASELAARGVRVNALSPGYIATPMTRAILERGEREGAPVGAAWVAGTPLGRLAEPAELAWPAVFLASDASSFMTGSDMIVDGGYTIR